MNTYKVYEAEIKTTPTGKQVKKLILQKDGAQHPTKNVSMWSDHPLFSLTVPGATINCDLIETDSGTPNPNAPGKNYINRTVANPNQTSPQPTRQTQTPNIAEMAIKTHIDKHMEALRYDLRQIAAHLGMENVKEQKTIPQTDVSYPEGEINPEDIPF